MGELSALRSRDSFASFPTLHFRATHWLRSRHFLCCTLTLSIPHINSGRLAITVNEALAKVGKVVGHQQITDAYLLGLAIHNRGRLATLDRRATSLLPTNGPGQSRIEVIG